MNNILKPGQVEGDSDKVITNVDNVTTHTASLGFKALQESDSSLETQELDTNYFKVNSDGWEEKMCSNMTIKISPNLDIIEVVEGDNIPKERLGIQFFTYEAALIETNLVGKVLPSAEYCISSPEAKLIINETNNYGIKGSIYFRKGHSTPIVDALNEIRIWTYEINPRGVPKAISIQNKPGGKKTVYYGKKFDFLPVRCMKKS